MPDSYSNTGTNADYASKMPDLSSDADIQKAIQAYHYGDPVNATAGSFSGSWTDPALGVLGKLIYLNDTLTTLDSAKIGKSLLTAKGGLISATAASTPAMLAVGTNGHVLKANSSTSTGLEWYSLDTTHLNLNPTSQTLSGDLTMSKASPRVAINASSGHSYITSSGASGSEAGLLLSTASVLRWGIQKIASGDNLSIIRYNDGGSAAGTPVAIDRSTGLTTLSSLTVSGATTGTTLSMSSTGSFGGKLTTVASGTGSAGFNVPTGTAPSSPVSGDLWTTTDGIYVRIDSTTYPLAIVADGPGGLSADNVTSGILAGQYGGTGVNNSGKTLTLSGNTTLGSSTHTLAFVTSGNTSVTLPTSGTLVNSAVTQLSSLISIDNTSTATHTVNIATGPTLSGSTKTINIGTTGVSGSTTDITIGSQVAGTNNEIEIGNNSTGSSWILIGGGDPASSVTQISNGSIGLKASDTGQAYLHMPHGSAPSSPSNGEVWTTTSGLFARINGTTQQYAPLASPTFTGTVTAPTFTASTSLNLAAVADTATAATHYYVETATDGLVRPKTLANVKTEIVTTAAVNSAAATAVGTITSGTWQGTAINATYIDAAIARLASPTFTGTVTTPGVKRNLVTKSALYTLTSSDHIVVATAGTWNATLPTAASVAGTEYVIKNSGTGIITVDTTLSQTIDGSLTFALGQYESITVVSDGSNWVII